MEHVNDITQLIPDERPVDTIHPNEGEPQNAEKVLKLLQKSISKQAQRWF